MPSLQASPYLFSRRKRIFDLSVSLLFILFLSPLFLIIALLIKLTSPGPVFFRQKRLGKNKKVFEMIKFRTMYVGAEKDRNKYLTLNTSPFPTFKILDDPRFVGIGSWLSHTGLDELPQLFNVTKGEMSIIGPRPLPIDEAIKIPDVWDFRYNIRPGILSSWAVFDRRKMTIEKWIRLDMKDYKHGCLNLDILLVLRAFKILGSAKKYSKI